MAGQGPLGVDTEIEVEILVEDADAQGDTGLTHSDFSAARVFRRTSDAVITSTTITLAASGDYAITELAGGRYTINLPASGGASFNNDTEGQILVQLERASGPWAYTEWIDIQDNTLATELAAILGGTSEIRADVQTWLTEPPAALEGTFVSVHVESTGADAIDAGALSADAIAEIADGIWDEAKAGHVTAGSFGEEVQAHALSTEVSAVETKVDTIDDIVDAILVDTGTTLDGKLNTIDGIVDDILVDTGTTIPGTITTIDNEIAVIDGIVDAIKVVTDNLNDTLEDDGSGTYKFTEASLVDAPTGVGGGSGATAQEVWEYATRGLTEAVDLNADQSGVTVGTVNSVAGHTAGALSAIANAVLGFNLASVSGAASRSLLNAARMLRNRTSFDRTNNTFTVYTEDDTTQAFAGSMSSTANGLITGVDPD